MPSDIKITARPTADPEVCRFIVDRPLMEGRERYYSSAEKAGDSPLALALLALEGVAAVRLKEDTVTVTRSGEGVWQELARAIGAALRTHLAQGLPVVEAARADDELAATVKQVIENAINPGLAGHGGFVSLERVEGNRAFVTLGGGCAGCAMSQMTLKQGIERQLLAQVPQLAEVVDVTDHASGVNPYYQS